jgi:hypothetical protein
VTHTASEDVGVGRNGPRSDPTPNEHHTTCDEGCRTGEAPVALWSRSSSSTVKLRTPTRQLTDRLLDHGVGVSAAVAVGRDTVEVPIVPAENVPQRILRTTG